MSEPGLYSEIGKRVRLNRKAARLTQAQLADAVGLARVSVSNLERGRQAVSLTNLDAIARALDLHLRDLLPDDTRTNVPDRCFRCVHVDDLLQQAQILLREARDQGVPKPPTPE